MNQHHMPTALAEVYLVDAASLRIVDANRAARSNLGMDLARLALLTPLDLAPGVPSAQYRTLLDNLDDDTAAQVCLRTEHVRADGSRYPVTLHFRRMLHGGLPCILMMGEDRTADQAAAAALEQFQARFNAIVSNMPGLVFQLATHADDSMAFPYLSDACQALLGIAPASLQRAPALFEAQIVDEDRPSFRESMRASALTLAAWNWEGRIAIAEWNDEKWINLRATPRALPGPPGGVIWDGIMTNITASRRDHARLAELTAHIEDAKEAERTRIAREIHDDVGGNLTAIKMALAMLTRRLPQDDAELAQRAEYVDSLVDRTIDAVHAMSLDLRPSVLDFGIVEALTWQAKEFEQQNGIRCGFSSSEPEITLPPEVATALFRIAQEGLTNIAKHAQATRVSVRLHEAHDELSLRIVDNGRGMGPGDRSKPHSFGLRGMAERAQALGGTLEIASVPDGGTEITIRISLSRQEGR